MKSLNRIPKAAMKLAMMVVLSQTVLIGSVRAEEFATPTPKPSAKVIGVYKHDGKSDQSVTLEQLQLMAKGGTNGGGGGGKNRVELVTGWCRGSVGILKFYLDTPVSMAIIDSRFGVAKNKLKEGIIEALMKEKAEGAEASLTYRALSRILVIADAIETQALISYPSNPDKCKCSGSGEVTQAVQAAIDEDMTDFLMKSYDFLIKISSNIDQVQYIPNVFRDPSQPIDELVFERAYVEYAQQQIDWITSKFLADAGLDGAIIPVMGQDRMYLRALSMIMKYVKDDLQNSLLSTQYACAVQYIGYLSKAIDAHLAGDDSQYNGSDKYAINKTYPRLIEIKKSLSQACKGL